CQFRSVRGTEAKHQLDVGREFGGGPQQVRYALLPGVPAHKNNARALRIDPERTDDVISLVPVPLADINAVVDHLDLGRVNVRIAAQDVLAHAFRGGDDGGGAT